MFLFVLFHVVRYSAYGWTLIRQGCVLGFSANRVWLVSCFLNFFSIFTKHRCLGSDPATRSTWSVITLGCVIITPDTFWCSPRGRVREDLIETFKLLKGIAKLEYSVFFKLSVDSKVRRHTYKIVKYSLRLDDRKNFVSNRVVDAWNELLQLMLMLSCSDVQLMQKL